MVFLAKIEMMHVMSFQTNLLQSLSRLILLINFPLNRETLELNILHVTSIYGNSNNMKEQQFNV